MRTEHDSMGSVEVDSNAYWGAQTQRSLQNFAIGEEKFPYDFIAQYALYKKCCSIANAKLGILDPNKAEYIAKACDEIISGKLSDQFPLSVWQTGSGTQTNMNVNEVIANRAAQLMGKPMGEHNVHPNDEVNRSQSSNDSFSIVMQLTTIKLLKDKLFPALESLRDELEKKSRLFESEVKIGRTHLMDALPMKVGAEFAAWAGQLENAIGHCKRTCSALYHLPIGGTAIGSGMNAPEGFDKLALHELIKATKDQNFKISSNKYVQIAAHDELLALSGSLKVIASSLMKIANDIRWLGSGPRAGLSELRLPANEPGSSIMPGKVNPTQCEAVTMVCVQVMGNDCAVGFAASHGQLQLNTYKPVIIHNIMQSINLLADASESFSARCVAGVELNSTRLRENVERSLMIVTALTPEIGYDKASEIAHLAYQEARNVKDIVLEQKLMSSSRYDQLTHKYLQG